MTGPGNGQTWRIDDHEKRLSRVETIVADREARLNAVENAARDCDRRMTRFEEAKVDVLVERIKNLEGAIRMVQRTLIGLVTTILGGVAIAVILQLGHG